MAKIWVKFGSKMPKKVIFFQGTQFSLETKFLTMIVCNSDPEYTYYCKLELYRWALLILPFMPVS